jgi:hypothetical protein
MMTELLTPQRRDCWSVGREGEVYRKKKASTRDGKKGKKDRKEKERMRN